MGVGEENGRWGLGLKLWSAVATTIVLAAGLALVGLAAPGPRIALAADPWSITQITDNGVNDEVPQVSGNRIVWRAYDGHDHEIMLYDAITGAITQLTDNAAEDWEPHIAGAAVVWLAVPDGVHSELMVRDLDTGAVRSVGTGPWFGTYDIHDGLVTWSSNDGTSTDGSATLFVSDVPGGATRQVPLGRSYRAIWPTTDGRYVLYSGDMDEGGSDVMLYDTVDGTTTRLSDAGVAMDRGTDGRALVDGTAVWSASDGHDLEVYLYDTETGATEQLTDNDVDDVEPQVGGDRVLWHQLAALQESGPPSMDRTIVLYDRTTKTSSILGTGFGILQEDGRVAAWTYWPQRFEELFVRDLEQSETTTIQKPGYDGSWPRLRDGRVVWYRQVTNARTDTMEIMLATQGAAPAVPSSPTPPYVVFADATGPYAEAVRRMGREGIVRGYKVGDHLEFHPEYTLLRSQFALMLSGAADLSFVEPAPASTRRASCAAPTPPISPPGRG